MQHTNFVQDRDSRNGKMVKRSSKDTHVFAQKRPLPQTYMELGDFDPNLLVLLFNMEKSNGCMLCFQLLTKLKPPLISNNLNTVDEGGIIVQYRSPFNSKV